MTEPIEYVGKHPITDAVLDSVFEVEDVLIYMAKLQKKVEHLEGLKKYRTSVLSDKINKTKDEMNNLRQLILNTMKQHAPDQTTVDFPTIGKATRKKARKKWEIENEDQLLNFLDENELKDAVVETKEKIVKKELDKVLNSLQKTKTILGATLISGQESVSIVYEKDYKPKPDAIEQSVPSSGTVEESIEKMEDLSGIEI